MQLLASTAAAAAAAATAAAAEVDAGGSSLESGAPSGALPAVHAGCNQSV
jgi:hypothetical protein